MYGWAERARVWMEAGAGLPEVLECMQTGEGAEAHIGDWASILGRDRLEKAAVLCWSHGMSDSQPSTSWRPLLGTFLYP